MILGIIKSCIMKLELHLGDIANYKDDEKVIEQTASQIIKDFGIYGIEIQFPADLNFAYDQLYDQLHTQIQSLLSIDELKLKSLLYTIDLPEKTIIKKMNSSKGKEFSEIITELVLDREFKKVLTRRYFKEQMGTQDFRE